MRISDWSSDVCSSDLGRHQQTGVGPWQGSKGTRLMKKTIFPVGNIKSDILRRAAMFIAFPLLVLWYFNWRLVAFPLAVLWNAIEAALRAAVESIRLAFITARSEEHTSELQSLIRIPYATFGL